MDVKKVVALLKPHLYVALERKKIEERKQLVKSAFINKFGFEPSTVMVVKNTVFAKAVLIVTAEEELLEVKNLVDEIIQSYFDIEGKIIDTRIHIVATEITEFSKSWAEFEKRELEPWTEKDDVADDVYYHLLLLHKHISAYKNLFFYILLEVEEVVSNEDP